MNKVFKIVFNAARGKMMVVNEATSSVQTGKKAAVTVAVIGALACGANVASADVVSVTAFTPNVLQEDTTIVGHVSHDAVNFTINGKPVGDAYSSTTQNYLHADLNGHTLTFEDGFQDGGFNFGNKRECLTGFSFSGSKEGSNLVVRGDTRGIYGFGSIDVDTLNVVMEGAYSMHAQGLKKTVLQEHSDILSDLAFETVVNANTVFLKSTGNNVVQVDTAANANTGGKLSFGSEEKRIGKMTIDASKGLRAIRVTGAGDFVKIYADELNIIANPGESIKADGGSSVIIDALTADINSDIGQTVIEGRFGWWCESKDEEMFSKSLDLEEEIKKIKDQAFLDPYCDKHPRLKKIDDITAIKIEI